MALLDQLSHPIVLAPMAGGPSTPELAAAVGEAGGLASLAAGYLTVEALADQITRTRALTPRPFAVNLFFPWPAADRGPAVSAYGAELQPEADRLGIALGEARWDDDHWVDKVSLLLDDPVGAVSFTFGCPGASIIDRLHAVGSEVWVTVTSPYEASTAIDAGADALIAQGTEAGGHRGTWLDHGPLENGLGLLALIELIRSDHDVQIAAAGGIATGAAIAAVLDAGAQAAAIGTAFLRCPEAGTHAVHRAALAGHEPTVLTRAYTGRLARGIANRFHEEHHATAPTAYPEVHHLTAPLRAAARDQGDGSVVNLWAGQAYELAREEPAADVVTRLAAELAVVRP